MFGLALSRHLAGCQTDFLFYQAAVHIIWDFPRRCILVPLDRIECVYWSTAKDLDTVDTVQYKYGIVFGVTLIYMVII